MKNFDLKRLTPIAYVLLVLILLFTVFKLMIFFLPFIIAIMIISIINPIVNIMIKYGKFKEAIAKNLVLTLFYLIVILVSVGIGLKVITQLYNFMTALLDNGNFLNEISNNITNLWNEYSYILPEKSSSSNIVNVVIENLEQQINNFVKWLLSFINSSFSIIKNIPGLLVFAIITILSSYLMLSDKEKIMEFIKKQLPKTWLEKAYTIKIDVFKLIINYFRAQLILITMCFFELFIGFAIINTYTGAIQYILLFSILIAIIDALPILGTGSVLIPWAIISIINKEYILGVSLIVLYGTIFLIRYYTEPKLISAGTGMHPLVTLVSMYGAFKFFGVIGFLYGPIIATIIRIVFLEEIEYGFFKYLINEQKEDYND